MGDRPTAPQVTNRIGELPSEAEEFVEFSNGQQSGVGCELAVRDLDDNRLPPKETEANLCCAL